MGSVDAVDLAGRQLDAIAHFVQVAAQARVRVWLRGGWAMDFLVGRVTRPHQDIDWFAEAGGASRLREAMLREGFTDVTRVPEQQVDLTRGDIEHGVALVVLTEQGDPTVAGGPWRGSPWPRGLLDDAQGAVGGVRAPIVPAAAQIEIKRMMPVWNPALRRRQKDLDDIELIQEFLGEPAEVEPGPEQ